VAAETRDKVPDPEDRAGVRIFAEQDERDQSKSRGARYSKATTRSGGDLLDATKSTGKYAEQGFLARPPTGQATERPSGPAFSSDQKALAAPDVVSGFAVVAVMVVHMLGSAIREWREQKRRGSGNNR